MECLSLGLGASRERQQQRQQQQQQEEGGAECETVQTPSDCNTSDVHAAFKSRQGHTDTSTRAPGCPGVGGASAAAEHEGERARKKQRLEGSAGASHRHLVGQAGGCSGLGREGSPTVDVDARWSVRCCRSSALQSLSASGCSGEAQPLRMAERCIAAVQHRLVCGLIHGGHPLNDSACHCADNKSGAAEQCQELCMVDGAAAPVAATVPARPAAASHCATPDATHAALCACYTVQPSTTKQLLDLLPDVCVYKGLGSRIYVLKILWTGGRSRDGF